MFGIRFSVKSILKGVGKKIGEKILADIITKYATEENILNAKAKGVALLKVAQDKGIKMWKDVADGVLDWLEDYAKTTKTEADDKALAIVRKVLDIPDNDDDKTEGGGNA